MIIDVDESILLEVLSNGFHKLNEEGASFDFPSLLLGNLANARPAVLSCAEEVLHAVDIGSLVRTLLLGSLLAFLIC
jgi:hypothetical protein